MMQRIPRRKETMVEIQMTNLVDVIFVLLIFFVVTTTFSKDTGVEISKPSAGSSQQLATEPILIAITREGAIHINDRQVDLSMLDAIVRREGSMDPDKSVVLAADRHTSMEAVVSVMDRCYSAGLKKVSVQTNKGE
jgi:biopolymer transport protein ExbD